MKNKTIALAVVTLFLTNMAVAAPNPREMCNKNVKTAHKNAKNSCKKMPTKTKEQRRDQNKCYKDAKNKYVADKNACSNMPVTEPQGKTMPQ